VRKNGFTVIELVIVIAIIAIVASIVIPIALDARISANERDAMAMMKKIAVAQTACKEMQAIDTDNDGVGEYGMLDELSGFAPIRGTTSHIASALLPEAYPRPEYEAVVPRLRHSGYFFQVFLPRKDSSGTWGITTAWIVGPSGIASGWIGTVPETFPDTDLSEQFWCAYAWPAKFGETGKRVFFVNQEGVLRVFENNREQPYSGDTLNAPNPDYDAAFVAADRGTITGQVDDDCWKPLVGLPH